MPTNPAQLDIIAAHRVFLRLVCRNPVIEAILTLAPALNVPNWYLTAGAVFQTVWNVASDRPPTAGILDYDLFYFDDSDLSYEAEDVVIRRAAAVFTDLTDPADGRAVNVEVRNEARVHLWYEKKFGVACEPFTSSEDAIDHFAATTCCLGIHADPPDAPPPGSGQPGAAPLNAGPPGGEPDGGIRVYAPHGFADLFNLVVRPNPVLAPREVYERKAARWRAEWPALRVMAWPTSLSDSASDTGPPA